MEFEVIQWDFKRDDKRVAITIKYKDKWADKTDNITFVTPKIRVPKLQIADLKIILKQTQTIANMKVFYSIYAKKIVEMEMGLIEMYNVKDENIYGLEMLQNIDKKTQFFRWGSVYEIKSFGCENYTQFVEIFEFYQNLVKERIFSIRTCIFCKANDRRKAFPYNYLMLFGLQDTIEFCLDNLTKSTLEKEISDYKEDLIKQRANWAIYMYAQDWKKCKNIIIPFQYIDDYYGDDDLNNFILIIAELNQIETQGKVYQLIIHLSNSVKQESEQIKIKITSFIINLKYFQVSNQVNMVFKEKITSYQQLMNFAELIEVKYFFIKNIQIQLGYIFNELPNLLKVSPYNQALNGDFILQDEERIAKYRELFKFE